MGHHETPAQTSVLADLHCHSDASFDSNVDPFALVERARSRGITVVAITDHGRIDGAVRARDAALPGITVIVGEEMRTTAGDLIGLFLRSAIPDGLSLAETIDAIRLQDGVIGLPHPFDSRRPSIGRSLDQTALAAIADRVDYVEVDNGRVTDPGTRAAALQFAVEHRLPGVEVSDAHTLMEVGRAATGLDRPVASARELLDALAEIAVSRRLERIERASIPDRIGSAVRSFRTRRRGR